MINILYKNTLLRPYKNKGGEQVGEEVKNSLFIMAGIVSASFGIRGFLVPAQFIDGGVTGISMLINSVTQWPLALLILIINLPFMWVGFRQLGFRFAFRSTFAIIGLSICLAFFHFPSLTDDPLLTALFGGLFIGLGMGLAMRGEAVLDGTDIAAVLISKKSSTLKVSDVILMVNVLIFSTAASVLGLEKALYSIVTYFAASKTVDYLVNGIDEYTGVTIVSASADKIRNAIVENMGRGVTVYKGVRGYGVPGAEIVETEIVYTVITRLEMGRLKSEVQKIDPNAFVVQQSVNDTYGGVVKKRPLH